MTNGTNSTNENGPKAFGLTEDGWDSEDLAPVMDVLKDIAEIKYGLENRVRGADLVGHKETNAVTYWGISNSMRTADTVEGLAELLTHMSEQLREAAEEVTDKAHGNMC